MSLWWNARQSLGVLARVAQREALDNVTDAIRQCLEVRAERGMPLTVATHEVEVAMG